METILIKSLGLRLDQIETWAQNLIGNEVPHYEDYIAQKIIAFQIQIIEFPGTYDDPICYIFVLLEVIPH